MTAFLAIFLAVGGLGPTGRTDASVPDDPTGGPAAQPDASAPQTAATEPAKREQTTDPSRVHISQLHTIFERKSKVARVTQVLLLATDEGKVFSRPKGYGIRLPKGARRAGATREEDVSIEVRKKRIFVKDPIDSRGTEVSYIFELPIENGRVVLEQRLQTPIAAAQAVTMWTQGDVDIQGEGFGRSVPRILQSDLQGLVIFGRDLAGDPLRIAVTGYERGPETLRRILTFALCIAFLSLGLILWIRRAVAGRGEIPSHRGGGR